MPSAAIRVFIPLLLLLASCSAPGPKYPLVQDRGGVVSIPLEQIRDGGVHFFTYRFSGRNIDFFVRKKKSGAFQTALDACRTCYKYHQGYRVEGAYMVCVKCGTRFPLAAEEWRVGGCTPIGLPSRLDKEALLIAASDLRVAARFF